MLKIDVPDKGQVVIAVTGSGQELMKDLILALNRLYNGIHRHSPSSARALKLAIQMVMADNDGPVWKLCDVASEVSLGYVTEQKGDGRA